MKKNCIIFLMSIIISVTAFGFFGAYTSEGGMSEAKENSYPLAEEYLRIHIRADSNKKEAQEVKYLVRDRVVEYLTPLVTTCDTKEKAMQGVEERLQEISLIATKVLKENGFYYGATAVLEREVFPTRVYGEVTLPAGEYSALILRLGKGEGENWWCVVYPPLCFASKDTDVIYKSKIVEIIEDWIAKQG